MNYIKITYATIISRLILNFKNRKITYDLLPFLFKFNKIIYTIILDAQKPAYFRYEFDKKKIINNGIKYFHIICRYLNFNEQIFEEISIIFGIPAFKSVKRIDKFETFLFKFYPHQKEIIKHILKCGKTFVKFINQYHIQYRDNAFYKRDGNYVEISINNRVMVDTSYFRKINPNYARSTINKLTRSDSNLYDFFPDKNPD
jgi:hypothetical protein